MWLLQRSLSEICGLPHVSLQPSAGAHGELAGLLLTRAYHADRGESRHKVLTPDTAHGTNPATVTMAGYEVVKVATDERGGIDVDDLRAKADDDVACLMLTNPNTLGLFDERIEEIAEIVHGTGATLYYDGANLNAVMGISRPGDMGFDIVHVNLHKSFSQPHGGGGPGAGPIAVSDRIEPFLPRPQVVRREGSNGTEPHFDLDFDRPEVDRAAARVPGQLRRVRALLRLHPEPRRRRPARGVRDRGAERQLPARPHARGPRRQVPPGRVRPHVQARVRAVGRAREAGAGREDARHRQAAARPRLPPADRLLPAAGRRGADGRADRDRGEGDAGRVRRRRRGDPGRGRAATRRSRATLRTRRRCGGSTRSARRSGRWCASRCSHAREDVEAVRRGYEAWNRGDVDAVLELVDPDIEWRTGATRRRPGRTGAATASGDSRVVARELRGPEDRPGGTVRGGRLRGDDGAPARARSRQRGRDRRAHGARVEDPGRQGGRLVRLSQSRGRAGGGEA